MANSKSVYTQILEAIFTKRYRKGAIEIAFERSEIVQTAHELGIGLPKNLGDLIYSFRYRAKMPAAIEQTAPEGCQWIIRPAGVAKYRFVLVRECQITPCPDMRETKVIDATPGIVTKYALNDEQALLARVRYSRLLDIFTGLACYSLQNHLRTSVPDIGQVEIDEIYIGTNKHGAHYVLPVQAKVGSDRIGVVQVEQDLAVCATKFPDAICCPIAAQFVTGNLIALFELDQEEDRIVLVSEKHYRLVRPEELSTKDLKKYQRCSDE